MKTKTLVGATFLSRPVVVVSLWLLAASVCAAQEFANIEYLCCDWGPAMKLPTKKGEAPQFSDTEEEIYFLKQVGSFTRKKRLVPDPFSGNKTEDIGHGISIYLCKMKPDGSEKTEIKELWHNPNHPIDTQGYSCWMNVSERTRKIALSVLFAGSDVTGLWTMNLDGSDLKRAITPTLIEQHLQAIDSPSWTPDGRWIVFAEALRGVASGRIAKCDPNGSNVVYLRAGPGDGQPRVSPDGKAIVYTHIGDAKTGGIYLMDIDGRGSHQLPNPNDKRKGHHSGLYPAWSPDGKRIFFIGVADTVVDAATGQTIWTGGAGPYTTGWPHWSRSGLVGYFVGGIVRTDSDTWHSELIGPSGLVEHKPSRRTDAK